jgi:hypothetical protein
VLGLIAWYAGDLFDVSSSGKRTELAPGNGSGNGNPYGATAAFGVVVFPLAFLRIISPDHLLARNVMCCICSIPNLVPLTHPVHYQRRRRSRWWYEFVPGPTAL